MRSRLKLTALVTLFPHQIFLTHSSYPNFHETDLRVSPLSSCLTLRPITTLSFCPLVKNSGRAKITSWSSEVTLPEHFMTPFLNHHCSVAKVMDSEVGGYIKYI